MAFKTPNEHMSELLMQRLKASGITDICVAPGSRSSPLVIAAHNAMKTHVHFDERGLGFFALGLAQSQGRPVAIITTSGTAVSNLLPAVTEAYYSQIPLLVLSADRPAELRGVGANQVIDQVQLFGTHVRDFIDIEAPNSDFSSEKFVQLVSNKLSSLSKGPVHLNLQLREPLIPPENYHTNHQFPHIETPVSSPPSSSTKAQTAVPSIDWSESVVAVGRGLCTNDHLAIEEWLTNSSVPILADALSGWRFHEKAIGPYEFVIEKAKKPKTLVWLGGELQSKQLLTWMESVPEVIQVNPFDRNINPHLIKMAKVNCSVSQFLEFNSSAKSRLHSEYHELHAQAQSFLQQQLLPSEPWVAQTIVDLLPEGLLYSGSSRPIRDFEKFVYSKSKAQFFSNRGTSGIDGSIATYAGLTHNFNSPSVALLGDTAALHDLNSLSLLRISQAPRVLVVINNDGGGIFSFLPVAKRADVFEKYFGAPHGIKLQPLAKAFGIENTFQVSFENFPITLKNALLQRQTTVIEVISNRSDNIAFHQKIMEKWRN